jgi:lipoprotein-releasing system permease protein
MLMIDKRQDMNTLRSMGADDSQICKIFSLEGHIISLAGAVAGIAIGLLLCWVQQEFGVISMGKNDGNFIVEAYPVSVRFWDIVLILATVLVVGWLAVRYPVRYLSKNLL